MLCDFAAAIWPGSAHDVRIQSKCGAHRITLLNPAAHHGIKTSRHQKSESSLFGCPIQMRARRKIIHQSFGNTLLMHGDSPRRILPSMSVSEAEWAAKSCLQNQQILRRSFPDSGERNAGIESDEPCFMLNRESKKVYVGQLPRSVNSGRIHDIRIQQTDFIWPEFMDILPAGFGKTLNDSLNR